MVERSTVRGHGLPGFVRPRHDRAHVNSGVIEDRHRRNLDEWRHRESRAGVVSNEK